MAVLQASNSSTSKLVSGTSCAVPRFSRRHARLQRQRRQHKAQALGDRPSERSPYTVDSSPGPLTVPSTGLSLDLATSSGQATAFGGLSLLSGVLAAGALLFPEQLLELLLPMIDARGYTSFAGLDPTLLRVFGATLLVSAAGEFCLKDAAANQRLSSATYQRLLVAVVFKSVGFLTAFASCPSAWTPQLIALYPTSAALSIYVAMSTLVASNRKNGAQTIPNLSLALLPQNPAAVGYSVITLMYLATAAACFAPAGGSSSLFVGELGTASQLLQSSWGPGFLLAAVCSLNLKDAADRGRLGASTFKRLNLGLAGLEVAYASIFASALLSRSAVGDASGVSNLVASLGVAAFCLYQWLYAKK